ncbi:MAG: endonuclease III [bacterium]|nr:endonuclease III [bacterium]
MSRTFLSELSRPWIKNEKPIRKKTRAALIVRYLKSEYPEAKMFLKYGNDIQLLVAVMLSAQCTDKKVNEVTEKLFKKYKTAKDFADADSRILEKDIHSTGFYRAKAKNIKAACRMLVEQFGGNLPRSMQKMLMLRGVARKTANVVLGNAFGIVEGIAVDTHVRRLAQRLGLTKGNTPEKIERDLMVLISKKDWFRLTYLLIEHGRTICISQKPRCTHCLLNRMCPSSRM